MATWPPSSTTRCATASASSTEVVVEHVVVPHVAPELVGEAGGVLGGDEDDGGVHRYDPRRRRAPARPRPVRGRPSGRILRMAIRPVVITGEPVLHQRAQPVEVIDDGIRELVADMYDTMDAARGVGLAAPQVGVGLRIFTWQLTNDDGIPPRGVVINPYLTSAKPVVGDPDPHEEVEGCLSVPGESFPLRRGEAATLTGLALDGSEIRYEATGWFARMLQHEYDHLNGFLYVDRLTAKWSRKARKAVKATAGACPGSPGCRVRTATRSATTTRPPRTSAATDVDHVVVGVVGPTATGKSDLAIALALRLGGEVVGADASQLYRGMDIGTAKVPLEERHGIAHHQLDVLDVTQEASVAAYQRHARDDIEAVLGRGALPVVAGGSGLYVRAALDRLDIPPTDPEVRAGLQARLDRRGRCCPARRAAGGSTPRPPRRSSRTTAAGWCGPWRSSP